MRARHFLQQHNIRIIGDELLPNLVDDPIPVLQIELYKTDIASRAILGGAFTVFKCKPARAAGNKKQGNDACLFHRHEEKNRTTEDENKNQVKPEMAKRVESRMEILEKTKKYTKGSARSDQNCQHSQEPNNHNPPSPCFYRSSMSKRLVPDARGRIWAIENTPRETGNDSLRGGCFSQPHAHSLKNSIETTPYNWKYYFLMRSNISTFI